MSPAMAREDGVMPVVLMGADEARLATCEAAIQRGFEDAGRALMEIRDERLYRAQYATFEDYCQERWGLGRNYVNRQIKAVEVLALLVPIGTKPTTESQAREMAPLLEREDAAEVIPAVWQEVQESTEPVTAQTIREAVRRHFTGSARPVAHVSDAATTGANVAYRRANGVMTELLAWPVEAVAESLGPESARHAMATTREWVAWIERLQELLGERA